MKAKLRERRRMKGIARKQKDNLGDKVEMDRPKQQIRLHINT